MYGLWCLIGLIVMSGGLGGLVYTLSSPNSHLIRIPWDGKERDSGFVGDMFIGVCGAFVAIGAAIPVFELDVSVFEQYWGIDNVAQGLVKPTIYVVAISVVGGFSGLRMISGLSDAMLQKLEKEVKHLDSQLKLNTLNDKKLRDNYKLLEGRFFIVSGQAQEGVELIREYLAESDNGDKDGKAWCWLAIGLKRAGDIQGALEAIETAIENESNNWIFHYNKACYKALLISGDESTAVNAVVDSLKEALRLTPLESKDELIEDIRVKDSDFEYMRGKPEFTSFTAAL